MDYIFLIISAALALYAIYQVVNIFRSEPVTATLAGFEESSHWDSDMNMDVTDQIPVYHYQYNGWQKTYRPRMTLPLPFLRKRTHKIYVRKDGKVFDYEPAIVAAVIALITFVVGVR